MESGIGWSKDRRVKGIDIRADSQLLRSEPWLLQVLRRMARNQASVVGALFLLLVVLCAIFAPIITSDPLEIETSNTLQPPNAEHWFGTDDLGRDIFSRVLWGSRISLRVGFISAGISTLVGLSLGLISGYYEGLSGFLILRLMDLLLAFPGLLLALIIVAALGRGLQNVMIAVGIAAVPAFARVVHGCVLSTKRNDYVEAARVVGSRESRIIIRHIVPNILASVIVLSTLQVAAAIFITASLSFVGLGAQPPTPEWGTMVSRARYVLTRAWWMSTFPGLAISLVVISINVLGDGLRDALDPRMRLP